jgi:hypothetical protein
MVTTYFEHCPDNPTLTFVVMLAKIYLVLRVLLLVELYIVSYKNTSEIFTSLQLQLT